MDPLSRRILGVTQGASVQTLAGTWRPFCASSTVGMVSVCAARIVVCVGRAAGRPVLEALSIAWDVLLNSMSGWVQQAACSIAFFGAAACLLRLAGAVVACRESHGRHTALSQGVPGGGYGCLGHVSPDSSLQCLCVASSRAGMASMVSRVSWNTGASIESLAPLLARTFDAVSSVFTSTVESHVAQGCGHGGDGGDADVYDATLGSGWASPVGAAPSGGSSGGGGGGGGGAYENHVRGPVWSSSSDNDEVWTSALWDTGMRCS